MPEERVMIVTGASSGIGAALARLAAMKGLRLVLAARRAPQLENTARAIREAGGEAVALAGDVTASEFPRRLVESAIQTYGRLDIVVNNAGGSLFGPLLEESDAAIAAMLNVHVVAPLRISRLAAPCLESTRGQLVFVGSGVARVPLPNYGAYPLAKAAIRAAAQQLRRELRSSGIGVTYVDPGVVATEFHAAMGIARPKRLPLASPERVARAILRGIERRRAIVNAVPWQTAGTALGEIAGTLADPFVVARFSPHRVAAGAAASESSPQSIEPPEPVAPVTPVANVDAALEPVARRMERVKLPPQFLRDALVPGAELELNALAMRWAGMPNKNERAVLRDALDALQAAGYLEPAGAESWSVVRAAD